jgi:peroxidase
MGSVTGTLATTRQQAIAADPQLATGSTTAAQASQCFALLAQHLAGNFGRVDPGQVLASVSNGVIAGQTSFLTRPQH